MSSEMDESADISVTDGLWANCKDSLAHALEHFWALRNEDQGFHHKKWIILSVHHASEVFVNYLLAAQDPSHPKESRYGRPHYPSLRSVAVNLPRLDIWASLAAGERILLTRFLPPLSDARDALMHRFATGQLDISTAAIALLGLLQVVKHRLELRTWNLVWQTTAPEDDVVDAISSEHFSEYARLIEFLVVEYYPSSLVDECPHCGAMTRTFGYDCEACFQDSLQPVQS